jgi:hypothetical protein
MSYWYGTPDEWQRLEAPLLTIDRILECFATFYGMVLLKNARDYPGRSLQWGSDPHFLIQLYLERETEPSWNVWRCCFEEREGSHFWRNDFAVRDEPLKSFEERLPALLEESFNTLQAWGSDPAQLEPATSLTVVPPVAQAPWLESGS